MSLHFQIDLAFDFKEDVSEEIIFALQRLSDKQTLNVEQQNIIPTILENEILLKNNNLSFFGQDIYYFKKQYRYTKNEKDIYRWTFHLRTMLSDDVFYEEGYLLIAWLSINSETSGFVGYIKEEFEKEPRIIYFENEKVIIKDSENNIIQFSYSDFN